MSSLSKKANSSFAESGGAVRWLGTTGLLAAVVAADVVVVDDLALFLRLLAVAVVILLCLGSGPIFLNAVLH